MPLTQLYPPNFDVRPIKIKRSRRSNRRTVTIPERVGPHVKLVFAEMARQQVTYESLDEFSGVRRASIKAWRRKNRPGLESLEAVLASLGFAFVPVPALEVLPPDIAGELTALALKLRMNIPQTFSALIDIGVEQKMLRMNADERRAASEESRIQRTTPPQKRIRKHPAAPLQ